MEEVLRPVGPWHKYIFMIALLGHLPYGLLAMSLSFMAPRMEFWCKSWPTETTMASKNSSFSGDQCVKQVGNQSVKCTKWEYDHSVHHRTLIEEWNAVCDNNWMLAVAQGSIMFGTLVGCFVFAHISDWYGRRPSLISALIVVLITGVASSFTPGFWMFCALRFIMAIGHGGKRMANTLAVESVGPGHRAIVTVGQDLGWCIGIALTPLVTYHVRDWVWIQRSVVVPEIFFFYLAWKVDESPKWLLSTGRYDEAKALLARIIEINGLDRSINVNEIVEAAKAALLLEKKTRKGQIGDLLREDAFFKLTMSHWIQFMIVILVYYQMIYFIVDVGSDPYWSVVYMGLFEIPVTVAAWYIVHTFRRKPIYNCFYTIALMSATALLFSEEDSALLRTVLANIGKMSVMILYGSLTVHVAECFPTPVRSVAIGTSQTASRLGAIIAPFLKQLGLATATWVPICLTVVLTAIAFFSSTSLPETFGRELPNTFHEAKLMLQESSPNPGVSLTSS